MPHPVDDLPPLKETMQAHGIWAKKSLGQHFLLDQNLTDKIARFAGDMSQHTVIEVGPGPGGLTRSILRHQPKQLIAIEKDDSCLGILRELEALSDGQFSLVQQDALTQTPQTLGEPPFIIIF